jgi:hypothetical protein
MEVPLGDGRWGRAGDDAAPGVDETKCGDFGLESEAPHLEPEYVEALGQRHSIRSAHQEDGVDEVHAAGPGVDGPSTACARFKDALALDVAELAPLGCQSLGGANLTEPYGQKAHRLGPG